MIQVIAWNATVVVWQPWARWADLISGEFWRNHLIVKPGEPPTIPLHFGENYNRFVGWVFFLVPPCQDCCQKLWEIYLLSPSHSDFTKCVIKDFLLEPGYPIERVTLWVSFIYLISASETSAGVVIGKVFAEPRFLGSPHSQDVNLNYTEDQLAWPRITGQLAKVKPKPELKFHSRGLDKHNLLGISRTDKLWLVPSNYLFCGWMSSFLRNKLNFILLFSHEKNISQSLESIARK